MREQQEQLLRLFPDRQMSIRNLVAQGDQVVLELEWWGTAAMTVGSMNSGRPGLWPIKRKE
jgi:predicted ester cyclase